MAIIQKEIELAGSKGRRKTVALFDSGATYSCIQKPLAQKLGNIAALPEPFRLATAEKKKEIIATAHIPLVFI